MLTMRGVVVAVVSLWAGASHAAETIPVLCKQKHCWTVPVGEHNRRITQCVDGTHLHVDVKSGQFIQVSGTLQVHSVSEVEDLVKGVRRDLDAKTRDLVAQMKAADEKVREETVSAINMLPNRLLAEPAKAELVAAVLKALEPKLQQMKQELQAEIDALRPPAEHKKE